MLKYLSCGVALLATFGVAAGKERPAPAAKIVVKAGGAGCRVELDADAKGATDAAGNLTLVDVEPGDHYIHVSCPGKPAATYFVSPKMNEEAQILPVAEAKPESPESEYITRAQNKIELRQLLREALQLRAQARLDEAVAALRHAQSLDPENADLHRELGITFLLAKDWKRARVEMIEALRIDKNDPDAHNGLGYALEKLGDIDGAVSEYRTATHLEPDDPSYRTHYFDALVKIQARKEAQK